MIDGLLQVFGNTGPSFPWIEDPGGGTPQWSLAVADLALLAAYLTGAWILAVRMRRSARASPPVDWLVVVGLLGCGAGQLTLAVLVWYPSPQVANWVRAATALVTLVCVLALFRGWADPVHPGPEDRQEGAGRRRHQERLQALVEGVRTALLLVNHEGRIVLVNAQTEELFGYGRDELVGQPVELLVPEASRPLHVALREGYFATPETRRMGPGRDLFGVVKDGTRIPIQIGLSAARTPEGQFVTVSVVDLTDRKKTESWLRELSEDLDQRVRERTAELRGEQLAAEVLAHEAQVARDAAERGNAQLRQEVAARERAEEALRARQEQLQLTLHAGGVGTWEWQREPDRVVWDPTVYPLFGLTPDAGPSTFPDFLDLLHPEDREEVQQRVEKALATGNTYEVDFRVVWPDWSIHFLITKGTVLRDPEEKATGIVGVVWDLTERIESEQALRESESRWRTLVQTAPDTIMLLDRAGTVLFVNRPGDSLLGGDTGTSISRQLSPEQQELFRIALDRVFQTREAVTLEVTGEEPGLGPRWYATRLGPVESGGEVTGVTCISTDISERKGAEEARREAAEELERSNAELEQFAYIASHDLQEPLRMVSSYLDLLAKRYREQLDEVADKYIDYAVSGAARMQALIRDLLAYSRVRTRGKSFFPVDCERILEHALANLKRTAEEKGAVITHDPLPTVLGDATQLLQLFQNLIGNALKFCEGVPRVHVGAEKQQKEWRFWVRDNGRGIPPDQAERIFQVFQRLHGPDEFPGTGIGLAICKKVVERHGGRIWVEAEPGRGSTFFWTHPEREGQAP